MNEIKKGMADKEIEDYVNKFPQQTDITLKIDVTVIIVVSISFFSIIYVIVNVYRYKHLSKSSYS